MPAVEKRRSIREVQALVGTATLLASQRTRGDEAHERMGVAGEAAQPLAVAFQAGVAPQRGARLCADGKRGRLAVCRQWWLRERHSVRLLQRRPCRPGAEDEALAQRVGGQAVGAMQSGAGALA